MDQGPLVTEQIDAGAQFARDFNPYFPLDAVFWLKGAEDGEWNLYLCSHAIGDSNAKNAYADVNELLAKTPHPWLDPFQIKVPGINPVVQDILKIQNQFPTPLPTRLRSRVLG